MVTKKPLKVGFDLDGVLLYNPARLIRPLMTALKKKLARVRTGRANPAVLEDLKVDAYGAQVPLRQIAQIGIPEARLMVVKPFDPSVINNIEKAILASDIGITPQNDGQFIRLSVPGLTEDRRGKIANEVKDAGEQIKVSLRNTRRDANKEIEKAKKEEGLPEDAAFRAQEDIQELLKKYEETVADLVDKKVNEVKTV